MAGHYLLPLTARENIVDFGDIKLFCNDGLVVLGNACFERFANITEHKFSGCVANRDKSGVLVLRTPVESLEYQYKAGTWYQRVPDMSTDSPAYPIGHIREELREYGIIVGTLSLLIEAFFNLCCCVFILVFVGSGICGGVSALLYHLFGIGPLF